MSGFGNKVYLLLSILVFIVADNSQPAYGFERACMHGLVRSPAILQLAKFERAKIRNDHLNISFIGHAVFFIETPGGTSLATDYNGLHTPPYVPDIVTMNPSAGTHYDDRPDPAIKFPLIGSNPDGSVATVDIRYKDMRVYNVPTNVWKLKEVLHSDSSVFVMESAGICIAHLGHLHHALGKKQLDLMGRIDILMVPIDGYATMSHEEVMKVIADVKPKLILPMHYHFPGSKQEFTELAAPHYRIKELKTPVFQISRRDLPKKTEVLFLPSHYGDTLPSVDTP
ncbi:MAG: MBL fold metallo-hydrolase [Rhodospirillaceae bacterium]|jgi:L-ascorbate metabolism protein UlaG (beta-lactamase superfamily)|nr:MBL fold metallo-hydrolase [Rhodospirillales bacterium]MBT3907116.1 MBL fold metallo-hydrolase [Rhodospirillaceae bacterium]MBT4701579.1 MBL fold metallo-hydrolase [Rhodospirillaceae bacterium]MBT5036468.1 MBL fold metallo-hydrolase [Rhodospirillaceae bacterium]MBT6218423.1 MBL fold metallo-hydrolase [Rhodospirillaceae bacterium]